jgi:hypothetical protein
MARHGGAPQEPPIIGMHIGPQPQPEVTGQQPSQNRLPQQAGVNAL